MFDVQKPLHGAATENNLSNISIGYDLII